MKPAVVEGRQLSTTVMESVEYYSVTHTVGLWTTLVWVGCVLGLCLCPEHAGQHGGCLDVTQGKVVVQAGGKQARNI